MKCYDRKGFSCRLLIVAVQRGRFGGDLEKSIAFGTDNLFGAKAPTEAKP